MPNGLEWARTMVGSARPPGIGDALDFTLMSVDYGNAVCGGVIGTHALNPMGFVHGGYISTLLDTACGFAIASRLEEGRAATTIDLQVIFHKSIRPDVGEVRAEGLVLSLGRRVGSAKAEIFDAKRQLLASATSSLLIVII